MLRYVRVVKIVTFSTNLNNILFHKGGRMNVSAVTVDRQTHRRFLAIMFRLRLCHDMAFLCETCRIVLILNGNSCCG